MALASAADAALEAEEGVDREPDVPDAALESAGMERMSDGNGPQGRSLGPELDARTRSRITTGTCPVAILRPLES